jgi:hypothetical protein
MNMAWKKLFGETERIYMQVGSLLKDADAKMGELGFISAHNNPHSVGMEVSADIGKPAWWFPGWVCRFYKQKEKPPPMGPLLHIAVLLYNRKDDDLGDLDEPVVTAGVWRYQPDQPWNVQYWLSKWWAWQPGRTADGTLFSGKYDRHSVNAKVQAFAVPLALLDGPEALIEKIIAPLESLFK